MDILQIQKVSKFFDSLKAVDGVSITVKKGSTVGLIGPNGSGKTTLFNLITGFLLPNSGKILFKDKRIDGLPPHMIANLGLVRSFQTPRSALKMSVFDNMLLACQNQVGENLASALSRLKTVSNQAKINLRRAYSVLELTELDKLANEPASHLSGGQRKLLSFARLMMREPDMILLDEPAAGVNPTLTNQLLNTLQKFRTEYEVTIFVIEHNMGVISKLCDKVIVLDSGKKIAEGTCQEIQEDERVLEAYLTR